MSDSLRDRIAAIVASLICGEWCTQEGTAIPCAECVEGCLPTADAIIAELVELRRVRGLTQAGVDDRIGISRPSVCMLERHYHGLPNIVTRLRYAEGVGAEVTVTVRRRQ